MGYDSVFKYQMLTIMKYLFQNKRIIINAVPFLIVFSLYYYIYDLKAELYILQKTQRLPDLTRFNKWNATLQKITNLPDETESSRSEMVALLQDLKKHVMSEIENMTPQIGLVESQSYAKILLISNWRSAGSFISSIIGSYPATLLHPEVLKVIVGMHKVSNTDKKAAKCIGYLKKLLTCDFTFLEKDRNGKRANFVAIPFYWKPFVISIPSMFSNWIVSIWKLLSLSSKIQT